MVRRKTNFIVQGERMNWISSACNRMAENYLKKYSLKDAPFFTLIYGSEGMGKSFLLQRCFQRLRKEEEGILFLDASSFVQQYAYGAQEGTLGNFRRKLRSPSLLIIDHLEFLEGKVHSIVEFYHTYEAIWQRNGRIICGFNGKLTDLDFLGEKLASRIRGGLAIPILDPTEEELRNFLDLNGKIEGIIVEEKVFDLMAQEVENFRDAEKLLNEFSLYIQNCEDPLDEKTYLQFATERAKKREHQIKPENIVEQVGKIYQLDPQEIYGSSRRQRISEGRQLAIFLIRELCKLSYPAIGQIMNRSHSSILKTCQKFEEKLKDNPQLNKHYGDLLNFFGVDEGRKKLDE
ncbi:MAG: chromosomal replication initiator DnaA [Desulfitobacterium sp.]|nr:chromosomal replication initiator DnaA [Desulfitobacterium sp.]